MNEIESVAENAAPPKEKYIDVKALRKEFVRISTPGEKEFGTLIDLTLQAPTLLGMNPDAPVPLNGLELEGGKNLAVALAENSGLALIDPGENVSGKQNRLLSLKIGEGFKDKGRLSLNLGGGFDPASAKLEIKRSTPSGIANDFSKFELAAPLVYSPPAKDGKLAADSAIGIEIGDGLTYANNALTLVIDKSGGLHFDGSVLALNLGEGLYIDPNGVVKVDIDHI